MKYTNRFLKGHVPWNKGKKHSEETIKKLREASLGKKHSEETKQKLSKAFKGRIFTDEWKQKISEAKKGSKFSEEHRKKLSERKLGKPTWNKGKSCFWKGENHPNWRGGISPIKQLIKGSWKYKGWRRKIYERDNFICQECNQRGIKLHPHHIKSFSQILMLNNIKTLEDALICDELWNINNGITLCVGCHELTDNYKNKKVCVTL